MDQISGYPYEAVRSQLFDNLGQLTGTNFWRRVSNLNEKIEKSDATYLLSFGENCGPAIRMQEAYIENFESGFFDNLVSPIESTIKLLDNDFSDILLLRDLIIDRWENADSVLNTRYGVFFHHYFHLRPEHMEKNDFTEGSRRRRIDETDIPLFLPAVMSQFEYLAEKMRVILRSNCKKIVVFRRVEGEPLHVPGSRRLVEALKRFGAINHRIVIIRSRPFESGESYDESIHRYIADDVERWGPSQAWRSHFGQLE